ncbi:UNVERIFIED_CONTAM: hypothetical protein FKN15_012441 [Acipenser sinensis]
MEGWRDGCRELEDLLGGLKDQGWCMACGVYGHTVAICPFQGEEEEEPAQERKVGRRSKKRRGKGKLQQQQQPQHQPEEQQPGCYCCAEPGHSSTNCPWYPLGQLPQLCPICGGEHYVACCPVHQEREEQGTPQSPPPAGEVDCCSHRPNHHCNSGQRSQRTCSPGAPGAERWITAGGTAPRCHRAGAGGVRKGDTTGRDAPMPARQYPKGRSRCVHSPKGRSRCVHSPKRGKSGLAQP